MPLFYDKQTNNQTNKPTNHIVVDSYHKKKKKKKSSLFLWIAMAEFANVTEFVNAGYWLATGIRFARSHLMHGYFAGNITVDDDIYRLRSDSTLYSTNKNIVWTFVDEHKLT